MTSRMVTVIKAGHLDSIRAKASCDKPLVLTPLCILCNPKS